MIGTYKMLDKLYDGRVPPGLVRGSVGATPSHNFKLYKK